MVAGGNIEDSWSKHIVPDLPLSVPVDEVALLEGEEVVQSRQVLALLQLGRDEVLTTLGFRPPLGKITGWLFAIAV